MRRTSAVRPLPTDWPLRAGLAALALVVGALLGWGCEVARVNATRTAATWAAVPERTSTQLGDLAPGVLVVQPVALVAVNDHTGLAAYRLEEEECRTVTENYRDSDGDLRTRTRRRCEWETIGERRPHPLPVVSLDGKVALQVLGGQYEGPMRTVRLDGPLWGDPRRAVGWSYGDALLVVGRAGTAPSTLDAQVVSGQSREAWLGQQQHYAGGWRFLQVALAIVALGAAGWACLGELR